MAADGGEVQDRRRRRGWKQQRRLVRRVGPREQKRSLVVHTEGLGRAERSWSLTRDGRASQHPSLRQPPGGRWCRAWPGGPAAPRAAGPRWLSAGTRGAGSRAGVGASVERHVDHVPDVGPVADLRLVEDGAVAARRAALLLRGGTRVSRVAEPRGTPRLPLFSLERGKEVLEWGMGVGSKSRRDWLVA